MVAQADEPEWPLALESARVTDHPFVVEAATDIAVREALARRFGLLSINVLDARVVLRRRTGGEIVANAKLWARVTQACVVTLVPVDEAIECAVTGVFTESSTASDNHVDITFDPDDESDVPEAIVDGKLNLGEWLSQQLSLAVSPYPRAAGATIVATDVEEVDDGPKSGPFSRLSRLRGSS